jgi:hypothetical protein
MNYSVFYRAEAVVRCQAGDLTADRPSRLICIFIRKSKGDHRRDEATKLVLSNPITANPLLTDLLEYYLVNRAAFSVNHYN